MVWKCVLDMRVSARTFPPQARVPHISHTNHVLVAALYNRYPEIFFNIFLSNGRTYPLLLHLKWEV
jgi:hypothetical protein